MSLFSVSSHLTRQLSLPLFAIIFIQLFFWVVYWPLVSASVGRVEPLGPAYELSYGVINSPEYVSIDQADMQPLEGFPHSFCCEPGYQVLRFLIDLDEVPKAGGKMLKSIGGDNFHLYVNGYLAQETGRLDVDNSTYHANMMPVMWISPGLLQSGENEFVYITVNKSIPWIDYKHGLLFDAKAFNEKYAYREFILSEFKWIEFGAAVLLVLLALLLWIRSSDRREPFWIFLIALTWAAHLAHYLWVDPPYDGNTRLIIYFIFKGGLYLAWLGWADIWAPRRHTIVSRLFIISGLLWLLAMAAIFNYAPHGQHYDLTVNIFHYGSLLFGIVIIVRLLAGGFKFLHSRPWEFAIAVLLITLLLNQTYNEMLYAKNSGLIRGGQIILIFGLLGTFFTRNIKLFKSQRQINETLAIELDVKTAELSDLYEREKDLVKEAAHNEERQRIMQDMHDGLGSTLTSLLLAARQKQVDPVTFEVGLQSIIDEMRLIINSMDSVGESLPIALSAFKVRTEQRVKTAGFELNWQDKTHDYQSNLRPRAVLDIFRIMQEAVTNSLKHSGGDKITILIEAENNDAMTINISDNGKGFSEIDDGGHGLENMQFRAKRIGGQFDIVNEQTGSSLRLTVPLKGID